MRKFQITITEKETGRILTDEETDMVIVCTIDKHIPGRPKNQQLVRLFSAREQPSGKLGAINPMGVFIWWASMLPQFLLTLDIPDFVKVWLSNEMDYFENLVDKVWLYHIGRRYIAQNNKMYQRVKVGFSLDTQYSMHERYKS